MSELVLLYIIAAIISLEFFIELFLEILNLRMLKHDIPPSLSGIYDNEKYKQMISYQMSLTKFGFFSDTFSYALTMTVLLSGTFGSIDAFVSTMVSNPILQSLMFLGVVFVFYDVLSLPFQWFATFVIEQKYGFNKTTKLLFVTDKLKSYAVTLVLGGGLFAVLITLLQRLGSSYWIYFWVVITVFMVLMNMFYTSIFVPMFNKLTPLADGDLKNKILDYCKKVSFPIESLFVIDGSKRSTKANAYFSGLGKKKKIVLYDTLINNHTDDELVAILAHEVGHFKKKHVIYNMIISILLMGATLYFSSFIIFDAKLSHALGAKESKIHLNLIAFAILYSPISTLTSLVMSVISRKNEYEADTFARHTFDHVPLIQALKKLSVNNLSNLNPHPWYVFYHYSHPTLMQRIKALNEK